MKGTAEVYPKAEREEQKRSQNEQQAEVRITREQAERKRANNTDAEPEAVN